MSYFNAGSSLYEGSNTMRPLRYSNLSPAPLTTRLRLQIDVPLPLTIEVLDIGGDGSLAIPGGFDTDLGPVPMFTVGGQPSGSYSLRCILEDPASGTIQAQDVFPFTLP